MSLLEIMTGGGQSGRVSNPRAESRQRDDHGQFANTLDKLSENRPQETAKPKAEGDTARSEPSPSGRTETGETLQADAKTRAQDVLTENSQDIVHSALDLGDAEQVVEDSLPDSLSALSVDDADGATPPENADLPLDIAAPEAVVALEVPAKKFETASERILEWSLTAKTRTSPAEGEPKLSGQPIVPTQKTAEAKVPSQQTLQSTMIIPPSDLSVDETPPDIAPELMRAERLIDAKSSMAIAADRLASQTAAQSSTALNAQSQFATQGINITADITGEEVGLKGDQLSTPVQLASTSAATSVAPISQTHAPAVTQQVLAHVAIASDKVANGGIEVRLEPEELGKLRLNFVTREGVMVVTVTAERPETLDLLRRNADDLRAGLSDMNFEGADLEFSDPDSGSNWSSDEEAQVPRSTQDIMDAPAIVATVTTMDDRLDIRL